jgi:hypothetical protein
LNTGPLNDHGVSYADLICSGIMERWSGFFDLGTSDKPQPVTVRVVMNKQPVRKPFRIRVKPFFLIPAHVISPFYRRIWGFFRSGQIESMGLNWTPTQTGTMIIPAYTNPTVIKAVAAHEMGHILGLGDAYGAFYRYYYAAPGTDAYMMHSNRQVQPQEIRMMIAAHKSGRMQYFPKSWQTGRFLTGLAQDIRQLCHQIRRLAGARKKPRP